MTIPHSCAVITPVGPGHAELFRECQSSVETAWRTGQGSFQSLEIIRVDDTRGELGRSAARNQAVQQAAAKGIEWLFFLDADDFLAPEAFVAASPHLAQLDALFGLITETQTTVVEKRLRFPQILGLDRWEELLLFEPYETLQMGHFVRTSVAAELPFDERLNTGEDFDYYLRLWRRFRCRKIPQPLFVNRRGRHSSGPRSATGRDWSHAVGERIRHERIAQKFSPRSQLALGLHNRRTLELQKFSREQRIATAENYFALSRQHPFYGYFEVSAYRGEPFLLFSNNDDLVVCSLGWTGSYEPFSTRLWQQLALTSPLTLDIGAYNGIYAMLAARANPAGQTFCFEPLLLNAARITLNLQLNQFPNVRLVTAAVSNERTTAMLSQFSQGDFLTSGASLRPRGEAQQTRQERVEVITIDGLAADLKWQRVGLAKIDTEGAELEVLQGMQQVLTKHRPDLLIEVLPGTPQQAITELLQPLGYRFYSLTEQPPRITETAGLELGTGLHDLNRWATTRTPQEVQQLLQNIAGGSDGL